MRAPHGLILIVTALLAFGVVMVTSAGLEVVGPSPSLASVLLGRPTILAAAALLALAIGARVPLAAIRGLGGRVRDGAECRPLLTPALWIAAGTVVLLALVHVPGIGREVNGARRWVQLGPVGFQPSEVAKWGAVIVLAWLATTRPAAIGRFFRGLLPALAYLAIVCGLIVTEDLGTAVLVAAAGTGLLVAAGARLRHMALIAPPALAAFGAAIVTSPYRLDRLRAFLDPFADPQGIGYHLIQSLSAVHGGGLHGRGLGNGIQKLGYLPEDTTDFVFAVVCEELGLMGAAAIVGLFAALLACGGAIVRAARDPFARVLGTGILLTAGLQTLINLAVVTGLAPTKGIALPLVSAGGTGWIMTAFSLGLLVSIARETPDAAQTPDQRRLETRALARRLDVARI